MVTNVINPQHYPTRTAEMSFGFGIGDFFAALDTAQKIREEFGDAPAQYSAIKEKSVSCKGDL
jgi:hypothetical protein